MILQGINVQVAWPESGRKGFHVGGPSFGEWGWTLEITRLLFLEAIPLHRGKKK